MTALLNDVIAEVYTITNRADLVSQTLAAVRAATLKLHQTDFYPKDIAETAIEFVTPSFIQSLSYMDLFPTWRKLNFLRKWDNSGTGAPGEFFELLTPGEILDDYGVQKDDICYIGGPQLEIRSSTEDTYMLVSYWQNPVLTEAGYDSWIARDHKFAVANEAARKIFTSIGLQERAAEIKQEVAEQINLIKISNI